MTDGRTSEEPRAEKPKDVISLISDDEHDLVDLTMESVTNGDECVRPEQVKGAGQTGAAGDGSLLDFIKSYCCDDMDVTPADDIMKALHSTPYCLYLYVGVELSRGRRTSVVLIGYFDRSLGASVVRPLLTLQLSVDSEVDAAESDAGLLTELLVEAGLPLSNLAVFYCDAPPPEVSRGFAAQLRPFSPGLLSLCGLPGMAGRACQAGLLASFTHVVELIKDVHHHYSTCSSVSGSLKELFVNMEPYSPARPVSSQSSFFIHMVEKMVGCWGDLVEYFKSLRQAEDAERIGAQLMDFRVRLHFLFLAHTLEPLRALQELQQYGSGGVGVELQLTSVLLHSYAVSVLQPAAVDEFLRRRNVTVLRSEAKLLPAAEVKVGGRVKDFLSGLGDEERSSFLKDAQEFYKAALQSLAQSVPEQLGDVALRNIAIVLKDPHSISVRFFCSVAALLNIWAPQL